MKKNDKELDVQSLSYETLLKTKEWKSFRKLIIERDNEICTMCNKPASQKMNVDDIGYMRKPTVLEIEENRNPITVNWGNGVISKMNKAPLIAVPIDNPVILHVHHLYYIWNHLPWEYDLSALKTVCHICHQDIHLNEIIPVYADTYLGNTIKVSPCNKCNGTGFIGKYHYHHDGICFECMGKKYFRLD